MTIRQQMRTAMAGGARTYDEIAQASGVTRERVKSNLYVLQSEGKVPRVGWPGDEG